MREQLNIQKRMALSKKRKNCLYQRKVVAMERYAEAQENQAAALQAIATSLKCLYDKSRNG